MRRDELYLHDIVEAAESIDAFLAGRWRESFMQDDLLRSAVLHKLTVIGEAAYFAIDWSIVWVAATQEAPQLKQQALKILAGKNFG